MKKWFFGSLAALFFVAAGATAAYQVLSSEAGGQIGTRRDELNDLEAAVAKLADRLEGGVAGPTYVLESGESGADLVSRLNEIEYHLGELRKTVDLILKAGATIEPPKDFSTSDGFLHADELYDQGRLASAANGYLSFLEDHPNHPDALDFWRKARDALWKTRSYSQAINVQLEMMGRYPEMNSFKGYTDLARLEKDAQRWSDAKQHIQRAADLATTGQEQVEAYSYAAWFVQLSEGDEAGLQAYNQALQDAEALGLGEGNEAKKFRKTIAWLEEQLAAREER